MPAKARIEKKKNSVAKHVTIERNERVKLLINFVYKYNIKVVKNDFLLGESGSNVDLEGLKWFTKERVIF